MKKLLAFGIIALFIGLAFIPSFNAVSISKKDNNETPLWDDYDERFAVIVGSGDFTYWEWKYNWWYGVPIGIVINISFYHGTFNILAFTKNPSKPIYKVEANKLTIKRFVGVFDITSYFHGIILGYAFGDIYWE